MYHACTVPFFGVLSTTDNPSSMLAGLYTASRFNLHKVSGRNLPTRTLLPVEGMGIGLFLTQSPPALSLQEYLSLYITGINDGWSQVSSMESSSAVVRRFLIIIDVAAFNHTCNMY